MTTEGEQQQYEETNILRKYIYIFFLFIWIPHFYSSVVNLDVTHKALQAKVNH